MAQKEHRAPTRYSLRPEEWRAIADGMKKQGKITVGQIRRQAKHYQCAVKPLYQIADQLGVTVIDDQKQQRLTRTRTAAEKIFSSPPASQPRDDEILVEDTADQKSLSEEEFDAAVELLAQEEGRIKARDQQFRTELEGREAAFAREVEEIKERLAQEESRARDAIRQTRQLREETRQDRIRLEDLSSELSAARREQKRLQQRAEAAEEITRKHKNELKASMDRERALLDALAKSEADLQEARGQQAKQPLKDRQRERS